MHTPADLQQAQATAGKNVGFLLVFYDSSDAATQEALADFIPEIVDQYSTLRIEQIDVHQDENKALVTAFNIVNAPTFVSVLNATTLGHVQGFDAVQVITLLEQLQEQSTLYQRLQQLITQTRVVLFMKGSPDAPRCGFSRKMIALLRDNGITEFSHVDILQDEEARQGIKQYSNWPTFPQLYANGKLIGGLDVVTEIAEDGELANELA